MIKEWISTFTKSMGAAVVVALLIFSSSLAWSGNKKQPGRELYNQYMEHKHNSKAEEPQIDGYIKAILEDNLYLMERVWRLEKEVRISSHLLMAIIIEAMECGLDIKTILYDFRIWQIEHEATEVSLEKFLDIYRYEPQALQRQPQNPGVGGIDEY